MARGRGRALLLGSALACAPAPAALAGDGGLPSLKLDMLADIRLATASGEQSWFDDWLGKGRLGGTGGNGERTSFSLRQVSLLARADIAWDWQAFVHAKYDPEQDRQSTPIDLVEAYVRYKPVPSSALGFSYRAGLFFPHISHENTDIGWSSRYSITPSAINSWVGEEVRALGVEAKATYKAGVHQLALTGAIFGFNDPAGTLLAYRGWAMGDYMVGAFSRLPLAPIKSIGPGSSFLSRQPLWVHPVMEVDGKPGFYGALDWSYKRSLKAGAFYYDNRGNPETFKMQQYGWATKFWNLYAEAKPVQGLTFLSQYMTGSTAMGFFKDGVHRAVDVDYRAGFALASYKFGRQRLSVRRDWFKVVDQSFVAEDNNNENGRAWTVALGLDLRKHDRIMLEYLYIDSTRPARRDLWNTPPRQIQSIMQLSYRLHF